MLFDTNFLNAYKTCSDKSIKRKIKSLVEQNKLQFFLNDILIVEWLAIFDTSHRVLLSEYAKIFIDLKANICFKQVDKILNAEIGILQDTNYFENQVTLQKLQDKFQNLAKGQVFSNANQINSILQKMRDYRKDWFTPQQADIAPRNGTMKKNKPLRRNVLRHNFNDIYNLSPVFDQRKNWVYKHFNKGQSKEIIPMSKVVESLLSKLAKAEL